MTEPKRGWRGVRVAWETLRGPRMVDLPIRVLLLVLSVSTVLDPIFDSPSPLYLALFYAAIVGQALVAFWPTAVGLVAYGLYLVYPFLYPDALNSFLVVAGTVLLVELSYLRIRRYLIFTGLLFAGFVPATALDTVESDASAFIFLVILWVGVTLMGLSCAWFEARLSREIDARTAAARESERELERFRVRTALDTHDTVAHGLAVEAAIIRILSMEARRDGAEGSRLTELAIVNAHTQHQLRLLLSRLTTGGQDSTTPSSFDSDVRRAVEMIRAALEAGGFTVDIRVGDLPRTASASVVETALLVLRELSTNVVKHSVSNEGCELTVDMTPGGDAVVLTATNYSTGRTDWRPYSLSERVIDGGGTCAITHGDDITVVRVVLPFGTVGELREQTGRAEAAPEYLERGMRSEV